MSRTEQILEALRRYAQPAGVPAGELVAAAEALSARVEVSTPTLDPTEPSKPWI